MSKEATCFFIHLLEGVLINHQRNLYTHDLNCWQDLGRAGSHLVRCSCSQVLISFASADGGLDPLFILYGELPNLSMKRFARIVWSNNGRVFDTGGREDGELACRRGNIDASCRQWPETLLPLLSHSQMVRYGSQ